jgi:hypothetical protein
VKADKCVRWSEDGKMVLVLRLLQELRAFKSVPF